MGTPRDPPGYAYALPQISAASALVQHLFLWMKLLRPLHGLSARLTERALLSSIHPNRYFVLISVGCQRFVTSFRSTGS